MTEVNMAQELIDAHAGEVLNAIRKLPISETEKTILECSVKILITDVARDAMHQGAYISQNAYELAYKQSLEDMKKK